MFDAAIVFSGASSVSTIGVAGGFKPSRRVRVSIYMDIPSMYCSHSALLTGSQTTPGGPTSINLFGEDEDDSSFPPPNQAGSVRYR